jgi:phosphatidylglycerophosphatase A
MAAGTTISRAPDARFLVSHPAHFIALGFGSGLAPRAPGTFGTLLGWGLYWLLSLVIAPPLLIAFLAVPLFFLGVWACDKTGRDLGVSDHGSMVWDEVVAFLPLAAVASAAWWLQGIAFLLFRLFDIWKPLGANEAQHLPGGWGIVADDVMAGIYGAIVLQAALWWRPLG